jgi:hypothetical protein
MTKLNKTLLNLFTLALLTWGLFFAMNHYSDGGCDGGLCGLLIFFHGIPYLFASLFFLLALNMCLRKKKGFLVVLVISFLIKLIVLLSDYGYQSRPKVPSFFMFVGQVILVAIYLAQKKSPGQSQPGDSNKSQ